ncbi:MAG TPA: protein-L-isoaspartate(D-aspartate) O-methyltransferase [Candidatus Cybelea sp.]|nr:protein-L-isoaspartate(D-aspartate) O-methyltransferase [Candidatus Cybelea sp.]
MSEASRKIRLLMELRRQGITDTRVLAAIERVPRENFVPDAFKDQAYDNIALPIHHGQTISQPYVVAYMSEALKVGPRMKVLEIGTGSGYQAAVLARLCRRVYSIERYRALTQEAEKRFAELRISNITTRTGDGLKGWPEQAPFDRIIVTAAAVSIPEALRDQLGPGGIMVLPVGRNSTEQEIVRITRRDGGFDEETLLPVRFVPLLPGVAEE